MSHAAQGSKRDSSSRRAINKSQNPEPSHPLAQRRSKSDQDTHASHQADSSSLAPGATRPPLQKTPSSPLVPRTHQRNDTAWQVLKPAAVRPDDSETFTRDSITDDPFFSRYRNPKSERLARDFKAQLAGVRTRGEAPDDATIRLTTDENHEGAQDEPHIDMNICVLGPRGVGKSTLIESTFDLGPSVNDEPANRTLFIDGTHYSLHFVERLSYDVCFQDERQTGRPPWKGDGPLARIDGAILLFDAMKPDTLTLVPQVLDALQKARIPNVLVSSKCDVHFSQPEIEPEVVEAKARLLANCQKTPQVTREVPDTFRNVVFDLSKDIAHGRLDNPPISTPIRRRSRSSAHAPSPPPSIKHSRAASDVSARSVKNSTSQGNISAQFNAHGQLLALPSEGPTKPRSNHGSMKAHLERPQMNVDTQRANLLHLPGENSPQSFLDLRDSLDIDVRPAIDGPSAVPPSKPERSTELIPMTFEDLVARLLAQPTSQIDAKFSAMFLTFYRFFAAPSQLLDEIMEHFVSATSPTIRERDLVVLDQWLNAFPGDFGHPIAKQKLSGFLSKVVGDDRIAAAAKQLLVAVELITEDDDTEWAESDSSLAPDVPPPPPMASDDRVPSHDRDRPSTAKTFFSTSSLDSSTASNPSTPTTPVSKSQHRFHQPAADLDSKMIFSSVSSLTLTAMGPSLHSPQTLSNSLTTTANPIASSLSSFNTTESAQRHAALLVPTNSQPLTKASFRHFLSFPDELIARELTRIDWIMFSSIRPRDIIRHVTVPVSNRSAYPSLENVTRMIDHFNHVAHWTTNLVLFRDKPKHRAQVMEKLMRVSRKLRELNNYNSLGALVAGMHGTSVHRLAATRALLPTDVQKDFMKLEILMGSEKGSFAYRLAWENSVGARVPFLPLHRRDLVVTEQGSRTFVDGPESVNTNGRNPDLSANTAAVSPSAVRASQIDAAEQEASDWYSPSKRTTPTLKSGHSFTASKSIGSTLGGSQSDSEVHLISSSPTKPPNGPEPSKQYINTPKLALLSTALLSLTAAQARPYPSFHRNDEIRSFLLDTVLEKDEENLYDRSVALEPAGASGSAGLSLGLGGHGSSALLAMGLGGGEGRRKIPIPAWLTRHGLRVE